MSQPALSASSPRSHQLRRRLATVLGLVLVPLVIVGCLLWAVSGADNRLSTAEAAIVNLDQGATMGGKPVNLGQTYALQLKNEQGPNFTWRYGLSLGEAEEGLAAGRFAAAVVIPQGFSRVLTGAPNANGDQATLIVERSPISGVSDQLMFSQLSHAATHSLSGGVTRNYLDELFVADVALGKALGQTSLLASEAVTGADTLRGQAEDAATSSTRMAQQATRAQQASSAVTSGVDAAQATQQLEQAKQQVVAQQGAAGGAAQQKALDAAAQKAKELSGSAGKASQATKDVAGRASAAGTTGAAAQAGAASVANAAAKNQQAADAYTGKVADVAARQQALQQSLAQTQKQLDGFVASSATVAQAVTKARGTLAAASAPATNAPTTSPTQAPTTTQAPTPAPTQTQTSTPTAAPTTNPGTGTSRAQAATQLRGSAKELAAVATTLNGLSQTPVGDDPAQLAATRAKQLGDAGTALAASAATASRSNQQVVAQAGAAVQGQTQVVTGINDAIRQLPTSNRAAPGQSKQQCNAPASYTDAEAVIYCKGWQSGRNNGNDDAPDTAATAATLDRTLREAQAALAAVSATRDQAQQTQDQLDAVATQAKELSASTGQVGEAVAATSKQLTGTREQVKATVATLQELSGRFAALADALEKGSDATVGGDQGNGNQGNGNQGNGNQGNGNQGNGNAAVEQLTKDLSAALDDPAVTTALDGMSGAKADALTSAAADNVTAAQQATKQAAAVAPTSQAAKALTGGAETMNTAAAAQLAVLQGLQAQLASLNQGMGSLGTAVTGLQGGAQSLSQVTAKVSDQSAAVAGQVAQVNHAITGMQQAAQQAVDRAVTVEQKAKALQGEISALQQSGSAVQQQTTTVSRTAATQLQRTDAVARQVARSQAQVPSFDEKDRVKLVNTVSTPINTTEADGFRNVGWITMLLVLALWVGAMALHSIYPAVSTHARRSNLRPLPLLAHEMKPAVVISTLQGLVVGVAGQLALHLSGGRFVAMTGLLMLGSVAFAAINHALVAFGRVYGRVLAMACALVTGATLVTQAYPPALDFLRRLSPLTPVLDLLRSIITGAELKSHSVVPMLAWLLAGALFSALAILRARDPEPTRVPTIHDAD